MGSLSVSQASWGPQGFYTIPSKRPSLGIFASHEIKKPTISQDVRHPYEPVGLGLNRPLYDHLKTSHLRHVHSSTCISSQHLPLLHFLSTYTYSSDRLAWDFFFSSFPAHRHPCSLHPRTHALRSAPHVLNRRTYWPCFFRCISLVDLWVLFLLLSYPFVTAGVGDAIFLKVNVSMPSIMISMTWRNSFR